MLYKVCFIVLRGPLLVCVYCNINSYKIVREKQIVACFSWLLWNLIPTLRP